MGIKGKLGQRLSPDFATTYSKHSYQTYFVANAEYSDQSSRSTAFCTDFAATLAYMCWDFRSFCIWKWEEFIKATFIISDLSVPTLHILDHFLVHTVIAIINNQIFFRWSYGRMFCFNDAIYHNSAVSHHFQQKFMCTQRRQINQCSGWSVFAVRMKTLWILGHPHYALRRLIRLCRCSSWSEFAGRLCSLVGKVVSRLIWVSLHNRDHSGQSCENEYNSSSGASSQTTGRLWTLLVKF